MANHRDQSSYVDEAAKAPPVAVVVVPMPAQGHLNQLLHLSRLISAYNLPIHFVSTATHIRQAKTRVHGLNNLKHTISNIHFHELPISPYSNPGPDPNSSDIFPPHLLPLMEALPNLREPFFSLVQKISEMGSARRLVVIYDFVMGPVVEDVRPMTNVECYCFTPVSAFFICSFYWKIIGRPTQKPEVEMALKETPSPDESFGPEISEGINKQQTAEAFHSGELFNTSRVLEPQFLDLLSRGNHEDKRIWALGPLNPVMMHHKDETDAFEVHRHKCLHWLDQQEKGSVVFVSFGTTCSLPDEQISELAIGLERSGHKFIWVLREADRGDIFRGDEVRRIPLPQGLEERIEGRGIVLRDWAPQLLILGHPSTGAFITHCGWNSCLEGISHGVPMGTWPMQCDQPGNAVLINKVLKIGIEVRPWVHRHEVLSSVAVKEAVRKLMESAEGEELRKRAAELGDVVRKSAMEGGASRCEMRAFIQHITR